MTRQEQNDIIIRHIDSELRELPNVQQRVSKVFNQWFQSLVQAATMPPEEGIPEEGAPA